MNLDDPKLTAFALDELDEPERSAMARAVAKSPEARRYVDDMRKLAQSLKAEVAAELKMKGRASARARIQEPANLIDIRDDPWFWSVARPLGIAAGIVILAILGALAVAHYKIRNETGATSQFTLEGENAEPDGQGVVPKVDLPTDLPNPWPAGVIAQVERVVVGELSSGASKASGEIHVIEVITDGYRVQNLKSRLVASAVMKEKQNDPAAKEYDLMFVDGQGHLVASAAFRRTADLRFVLQPLKHATERNGHYFSSEGTFELPGAWRSGVDYREYSIPFPDWAECIGYSPGA